VFTLHWGGAFVVIFSGAAGVIRTVVSVCVSKGAGVVIRTVVVRRLKSVCVRTIRPTHKRANGILTPIYLYN